MRLDHATIVTDDLDGVCRFFAEVAGLTRGPRPPFAVDGGWFYADGRPVIHVVRATQPAMPGRGVPRIDHVALRVDGRDAWAALIARVQRHGLPHQVARVPLSGELQLFVPLAPGVMVEFVTALQEGPAPCAPAPLSFPTSDIDHDDPQ
jgi:catechol 2,3-dioxygenase-like lactoylglutathione lyase family enzyme